MKLVTSTWFEVKARYEQTQEDGTKKRVSDSFVIAANDFAEAYTKGCEYVESSLTSGDYGIIGEKIASYKEAFFSDDDSDDKFYRVKMMYITLDEKSGKEKKTPCYHLVQASSIDKARKYIVEAYSSTMTDYTINEVVETRIIDAIHK